MSDLPTPDEQAVPTTANTIPHNREAEEAVVGAVLINPEVYYDLAQFLQPEDFYIHRHRWIWEAFMRLHEQRIPLDILTITEELEKAGQLEEIGGPAYLTALLNQVPTSLHAEAYGHMVEAASIRRRMLTAANQIATLAYDQQEAVENVIEEAEKSIFSVSERRLRHDLLPISRVLSDYYDRIDELARRPEDIFGVPTGFIDLDRMLAGLQPSDLLIIAGRPGQGKTGFLLSVAKNAALLHKKHVAIFSLEMSNEQVVQRLLAQETGIDSQRLRTGKLSEDEWPLLTHSIEVLGDTNIYLDDTPAITPLQLRTKCRRLHMEFGLDLVILDYLQLMGGDVRNENRVQEVSYISRNLKVLARELNVPVLAAAQLSRAVEQRTDKRPVLSDLRESGCLSGETLVSMADTGLSIPIRELENQSGFLVWALNPATQKIERMPVSRAFCTGTKPVYRMTTRLGHAIRATANHQFLTIQGWKRLDLLRQGDSIARPRLLPCPAPQAGGRGAFRAPVIQCAAHEGDRTEKAAPRLAPEPRGCPVWFSPTRFPAPLVRSAPGGWLEEWMGIGLRPYHELLPQEVSPQPVEATAQSSRTAIRAEKDIHWDSIVSIEPDGDEPVYDLTVPGHHNFVANQLIVHNSLEQDADIVMFIYRPDQYEKDTVKQNVAEILVAKHRNGPTGSIELVFMNHLAKFVDAATRNIDLTQA